MLLLLGTAVKRSHGGIHVLGSYIKAVEVDLSYWVLAGRWCGGGSEVD